MRRNVWMVAAAAMLAGACARHSGGGGVKLASEADSVAYVIGMNVGLNLQRMDSTLQVEALCAGIREAFAGKTRLSVDDARTFFLSYRNYILPEKARAYEEQFLADIAKSNRSYARTASGVTYTVSDVGDQQSVPTSERDSVAVRYLISSADGRKIYSSYDRGDTLRVQLRDLRPGVRESLRLIGRGGRIEAWVPAAEAYGAEGDKELGIAPNATLRYEIELVEVDKYAAWSRRSSLRR